MAFSVEAKLKAMAIVHIFETGKPLGSYSTCVVLNDGAGISYGKNQFTHRSGSLYAVVAKYLAIGGPVGRDILAKYLPILKEQTRRAIETLSGTEEFKAALRAAGKTLEMHDAQNAIAFTRYLSPAIAACEGSNFTLPLSLAVIYDSINHGSYEKIRDQVRCHRSQFMADAHFEKAWIGEYVQRRDKWLRSVSRLRSTAYRTGFFLVQIAQNNWEVKLPVNVHGYRLTDSVIEASGEIPSASPQKIQNEQSAISSDNTPAAEPQSPNTEEGGWSLDGYFDGVVEGFDRVSSVAENISSRKAAARSLGRAIRSVIMQPVIALLSFAAGVPVWIWIAAAIMLAALTGFFLYRHWYLGAQAKVQK